jgi:hypothetical protein
MKSKHTQFWVNLYKRLFVRNREHVGIRTSYNLYRLHPILRFFSKGRFIEDENPRFPEWVEDLKARRYDKVLLLGNAPCLNDLSPELFEKLKAMGYLTIGLNRSLYMFDTDILIWSDLLTIDEILRKRAVKKDDTTILHVRLERDHRVPAAKDKGFHALHKYWSKNKNFKNWKKSKLFMFRNSAIPALHLCYKIGVKEVVMIGFGFDNREYFYKTDKYKEAKGYEIISADKLDKNCGGYDTQRIVKEILEYLTQEENFKISYNGNSPFLSTVAGLTNIDVGEFEKTLRSRSEESGSKLAGVDRI